MSHASLVPAHVPLRRLAPLLLAVLVGGCSKDTTATSTPGALVLVQGNNQLAQGGTELPNPVVVRLTGTDGKPIEEYPVGFSVQQGGGTVNPGSALSDENGEVKVKWTVGHNEPAQLLQVSAGALEPLVVTATAILPSDLIVAQGTTQTAKAGAALPNPIVVRVLGPGNVPMKGVTVAFQVTFGGGLISPQSAVTNAAGEVTARWTLGSIVGTQSLLISSGTLQALTLQAIAQ